MYWTTIMEASTASEVPEHTVRTKVLDGITKAIDELLVSEDDRFRKTENSLTQLVSQVADVNQQITDSNKNKAILDNRISELKVQVEEAKVSIGEQIKSLQEDLNEVKSQVSKSRIIEEKLAGDVDYLYKKIRETKIPSSRPANSDGLFLELSHDADELNACLKKFNDYSMKDIDSEYRY